MQNTWVIQRKMFRSDWETIAVHTVECSKAQVLLPYAHMVRDTTDTGRLRAIGINQAQADYEAGRADDYRKKINQ